MTRELPLLCTGSVVRAILEGRQTEDRRPVRPQPEPATAHPGCRGHAKMAGQEPGPLWRWYWETPAARGKPHHDWGDILRSPFGSPGDLLYVREALRWAIHSPLYDADGEPVCDPSWRWPSSESPRRASLRRPSIHMPKRLARIWLRVEDVWVERVQDITRLGCVAEGWPFDERQRLGVDMARAGLDDANISDAAWEWFAVLWDSLYAKRGLGWDADPWVWVCRFSVASTTGRPT